MANVDDHTPFTPGWIDIGTDVAGARTFYTAMFGWDAADAGPPEESGGYGFFLKDGRMVAGFGPQQNPGPPVWSMYVMVPDADEIATKVTAAGGTVVVPPMDVMDAGRMGVFQDSTGAFFSVWQPGQHRGAQTVREPGSFTWSELDTRDVEGAKAFYAAVFGWGAETSDGGGMTYTEWKVGGESVGGMMDMPPGVPDEVPPYWLVYLAVEDVDAAVGRVQELGGTAMMPGMDFPGGRFAVVSDPQGGMFGLMSGADVTG
jgi:predicted enzyme related to lactoylglutathione lyase